MFDQNLMGMNLGEGGGGIKKEWLLFLGVWTNCVFLLKRGSTKFPKLEPWTQKLFWVLIVDYHVCANNTGQQQIFCLISGIF